MKQSNRFRPLVAVIVTIALLGGMSLDVFSRPSASDSEPFHAQIRQMKDAIPMNVGNWEGTDEPPTAAAIKLLKPNVILHRRYINRTEQEMVGMLLVQTRDARDMLGHYPPVCYPGNGWLAGNDLDYRIEVADLKLNGKVYNFHRRELGGSADLQVVDLILLPNGQSVGSMDAVRKSAADFRFRHYGAAQMQFVFHMAIEPTRRDEIIRELLEPNLPLIRQLLAAPLADESGNQHD